MAIGEEEEGPVALVLDHSQEALHLLLGEEVGDLVMPAWCGFLVLWHVWCFFEVWQRFTGKWATSSVAREWAFSFIWPTTITHLSDSMDFLNQLETSEEASLVLFGSEFCSLDIGKYQLHYFDPEGFGYVLLQNSLYKRNALDFQKISTPLHHRE